MLRSMTGYGRGLSETEGRSVEIVIKSVNSRYFDFNLRMPKTLLKLEDRIRKIINEKITRGKVDVFLTYKNTSKDSQEVIINEFLALKIMESLKSISRKADIDSKISLDILSRIEGVISIDEEREDEEEVFSVIDSALKVALKNFQDMRISEGENLLKDINEKRDIIKGELNKIEVTAPSMMGVYREKLSDRVKELNNSYADEERIALEVALFSDRSSIDEEITRLKSHLMQLDKITKLREPNGKKLDFLIQEMNREANTIASKSQDIDITGYVLEIKNQIEKIREQVQNIE